MDENSKKLIQISPEEQEIINDLRKLDFGKVLVTIQNGNIIQKEITKTIKIKNKGQNGNGDCCEKIVNDSKRNS